MRYNILVLFCFFFTITKAQNLDKAKFRFEYFLTYSKNLNHIETKSSAVMTLDIGDDYSKFYSQDFQTKDSLYEIDIQLDPLSVLANVKKYRSDAPKYSIYKKYPSSKELTVCNKIFTDYYKYKELTPIFKWKFSDETKEILNFSCSKASCTYAGREYIAWFTSEIAIMDGPWKFSGTPGMILEAYDTQKHYHFECISSQKLEELSINIPKKSYFKISKTEMANEEAKIYKDKISYMENMTGATITRTSAKRKRPKFSYNPMER